MEIETDFNGVAVKAFDTTRAGFTAATAVSGDETRVRVSVSGNETWGTQRTDCTMK